MTERKKIPGPLRSTMLLANQHACCICGEPGVHIHHIDGDNSNNDPANLAVLCLKHHDEATAAKGLTAKLRPEEIAKYKTRWETACLDRVQKGARARTAFFMVDYKNAERLRQLFSQLSSAELENAFHILTSELRDETKLREAQGYNVSNEPTLAWNGYVEKLMTFILDGNAHPSFFDGMEGHPQDPLFPGAPVFSDQRIALYDIWCQLMARVLVVVRTPYVLEDFLRLENPTELDISGSLVAFNGSLRGDVAVPGEWQNVPVSQTTLTVSDENTTLSTELSIKTHYIYSMTGAESLEGGRSSGLLILRSFESFKKTKGRRIITFRSTPLIMGSGGGKLLEIP